MIYYVVKRLHLFLTKYKFKLENEKRHKERSKITRIY